MRYRDKINRTQQSGKDFGPSTGVRVSNREELSAITDGLRSAVQLNEMNLRDGTDKVNSPGIEQSDRNALEWTHINDVREQNRCARSDELASEEHRALARFLVSKGISSNEVLAMIKVYEWLKRNFSSDIVKSITNPSGKCRVSPPDPKSVEMAKLGILQGELDKYLSRLERMSAGERNREGTRTDMGGRDYPDHNGGRMLA